MYTQYQQNVNIRRAIEDVLGKIKEALQLIQREESADRMGAESVTKLRDILQYSLTGYTNVKHQIGKMEIMESAVGGGDDLSHIRLPNESSRVVICKDADEATE